ncbi:hypothetical protein OROMI_009388 [Orobanche minor]
MGEIVFFHLKYNGESKLISVNSTTSFDDFIAQASGKWNGITDVNMVLRYSIADVRNCRLDCEDDLRNLFSICQILSAKLVFVDISRRVEKHLAMIEHQNDTALKNKPLLSDNWCHILDDGVGTTFSEVDHSYIGKLVGNKNTLFGAKISGNLVVENIRADPNCNGKDIQKTLRVALFHLSPIPTITVLSGFFAFKACLDGFKKCRPMLFIDGTFMIGRAKGTLLGATAKDGDNGLLPVAIAILSAENTSNWVWFLEKLRDFVHHEKEICNLSDRNTGLMSAFPKVFTNPIHLFCLYHFLANLRGRFTKGWTNAQHENLAVHFKNCAYGEMTSNAAEQFNAWIKEARSLPITYMIEHIRRGILQWIVNRRQDSLKWTGALCPRKENIWNFFVTLSRSWMVVDCPSGKILVLPMASQGFPCVHGVAVIRRKCPTVYSIVEEHFFTNTYRACYSFDIHSIPQTEKFEFQPAVQNSDKILPPIMNRQPGRPKGKRSHHSVSSPRRSPLRHVLVVEISQITILQLVLYQPRRRCGFSNVYHVQGIFWYFRQMVFLKLRVI